MYSTVSSSEMAIDPSSFQRQVITGWLAGLFAPVIGYLAFTSLYFKGVSFLDVFELFQTRKEILRLLFKGEIYNAKIEYNSIKLRIMLVLHQKIYRHVATIEDYHVAYSNRTYI